VNGPMRHLSALHLQLVALENDLDRIGLWGEQLASVCTRGGRVLAVGNGGSAAHAQHLTAELVGRYQDDRPPFSAIALHTDTSSVTAIANDYGVEEIFARQVRAHGRPGDVLVAISTSGRSPNVLAAIEASRRCGMRSLAVTGPAPNPLCVLADDAVSIDAPSTATVQEVHQVVVHLLCLAFDHAVLGATPSAPVTSSRQEVRTA
jgi:D-sedoheptulose 7-phosphate isomerase